MFFDDLESLYWLRCRFAVEGDGIKREICIGRLSETEGDLERKTDREIGREKERKRERDRERDTEIGREKETERERVRERELKKVRQR